MLRAGVLAVVLLGLACVAHVAGRGSLPDRPALLLIALLVSAECAVVTRRRLGPIALLGVMTASQLVLHELFMALAMPIASSSVSAAHAGMPMTPGPGPASGASMMSMQPTVAATAWPLGLSMSMLLCHVATAALLTGLLAFGESVLWRLWCMLIPRLLRLERPLLVLVQAAAARLDLTAILPRSLVLLVADRRRGPPEACFS